MEYAEFPAEFDVYYACMKTGIIMKGKLVKVYIEFQQNERKGLCNAWKYAVMASCKLAFFMDPCG
jgi:hypothetical protein